MMARCIGLAACLAVLMASGCVCRGPDGCINRPLLGNCQPNCDASCMPGLKYDRVWRCDSGSDCGPNGCGPMSYYHCGALPMLRAKLANSISCGHGCGEVYWGEWASDPPDCCDPCDSCGTWQHGQCCSPGFFSRIWWGLHGYKLGGQHGDANYCGGCNGPAGYGSYKGAHFAPNCGCGSGGCATCGHAGPGGHGMHEGNILHENWEHEPLPVDDTPIHKAQQPTPARAVKTAAPPARSVAPTAPRLTAVSRPKAAAQSPAAARRENTASPRPWSPVAARSARS